MKLLGVRPSVYPSHLAPQLRRAAGLLQTISIDCCTAHASAAGAAAF